MIQVLHPKLFQYFANTPEERQYFNLLRKYHYFATENLRPMASQSSNSDHDAE